MHFSLKSVFANSFLALLVSTICISMVFAVRVIIDPLYHNHELIDTSQQIFSIFVWPYNLVEQHFIGFNEDFSHKFHTLWSPVGFVLTLLYITFIGNLLHIPAQVFTHKKTHI